jgi:translation initiation factor IF-2
MLDPKEIELRKEEQRRHKELAARQAAEFAERLERDRKHAEQRSAEQRAAEEQARKAAEPQPAAPATPASTTTTTLHRPKTAPAGDKKAAKKPAKTVTVWKDESAKKRGLKTRGDSSGASGWHAKGGRHRGGGEVSANAAPVEFVVRDVDVP